MCGRYTLTSAGDVVGEEFGLEEVPELEARYNISPGQQAPVVQVSGSERRLIRLHWGFAPAEKGGRFLINARSETVSELPSFAGAFESRRCLVPASGGVIVISPESCSTSFCNSGSIRGSDVRLLSIFASADS